MQTLRKAPQSGAFLSRIATNHSRICLLGIIGIGLILRFWELDRLSFWYDETTSAGYADSPTWHSMFLSLQGDVHPIGYFALLRLWSELFGNTDFSLRALSAMFGVLAIPLMLKVARRVCELPQALLATLIFTLSPFQIYYSQEARAYSLVTFLVLLSFALFLDLWRAEGRIATAFSLALVNASIVFTNYCAGLAVIAQILTVATLWGTVPAEKRREVMLLYGGSLIFSAVLFAPWLKIFSSQFHVVQQTIWISSPDADDIVDTLTAFMLGWRSRNAFTIKILFAILSLCAVAGLLRTQREDLEEPERKLSFKRGIALALIWLLFPITAGWLWSQTNSSIYIDRAFIGSSPALYLLIAILSDKCSLPLIRLLPVPLALIVMLRMYPRLYTGKYKEDWRSTVSIFERRSSPSSQILFESPAGLLTFRRYATRPPEVLTMEKGEATAEEVWIIRSLSDKRLSGLIRQMRRMGYRKRFFQRRTGIDIVQMKRVHDPALEGATDLSQQPGADENS